VIQPFAQLPHAGCPTCGGQDACLAGRWPTAAYPQCRRPLRSTSLSAVHRLFAWMQASLEATDERLQRLAAALAERFARDRQHYSEVFEPSFSSGPGGTQVFRFSYAFPGYSRDPGGCCEALRALAAPLPATTRAQLARLTAALGELPLQQALFGLAAADRDRLRTKLYLQFDPAAGAEALAAAARLTAIGDLSRRFAGRELHLLGIDLGARGIVGIKLYFQYAEASHQQLEAMLGPQAILDELAELRPAGLRRPLLIHRAEAAADPGLDRPAALDFGLLDNDLRWPQLAACPTLAAVGDDPAVAELLQRFRLAVRRVSLGLGRRPGIKVYYVLTEPEPA
jgi:hypothetical protein